MRSSSMLLAALAALTASAGSSSGQETAPRLPFGSAVVVLPVQASLPSPGGSWPGRVASAADARMTMDAELAFALRERRGAQNWALPEDLRERVERNPMMRVDPDRVAYQGLLAEPDRRDRIYEPLHSELRTLAALFDTRFVVLPLVLSSRPAVPAGSGDDQPPANLPTCDGDAAAEQAELLLALIDIRRSAVLWHGTVRGAATCPDAGGQLAGLASTIAGQLTES